ncbi:uncharacterized protein N7477_006912 [Penicillium maclennaniae]|uniref:uncharacterized protein n=1 Tax=Penicillium maclennaniae TaxID=1343394 RepID=UPI002540AEB8|nr:uncharacterized protein N7477_006912 [Penicillium maclennaniae]KAJ5668342.1 hypothetical protein N7477_006912 [Penicillium maclennaniae]
MLLKPATPLTILLLVAFALLLISCLSTPIIKGIPLATYSNVDYGVFGYCQGDVCTNIHVGYKDITSSGDEFNLPSGTRKSLSSILIIHPVAAFLTLICLCLAGAAHFHGPSHSPRYLLALLILLLPTLLVTLLAFLVDILLFVPHLQWGGWIVLAATILLVSCGVVTCAMRRTLVSRKARKRRIAENAEMSGENYYNRQNAATATTAGGVMTEPTETKEAMVTGSPAFESSGPTLASFHTGTHDSDDDRTPLNTADATAMHDVPPPPDAQYPSRRGTPYRTHDDAGVPLPGPYGPGVTRNPSDPRDPRLMRSLSDHHGPGVIRNPSDPRLRQQYQDVEEVTLLGAGMAEEVPTRVHPGGHLAEVATWAPPPRIRGGMIPGRGAPRSGMGYAPVPNRGYAAYSPPTADAHGAAPMDPFVAAPVGPMREPSPGPIGMAVSPETVGQAIEMQPQPRHYEGHDSPATVTSHPHAVSVDGQLAPLESPTSLYSRTDSYVPARAGGTNDNHHAPSPGHTVNAQPTAYYEDVDPRFARRPSPPSNSSVPRP